MPSSSSAEPAYGQAREAAIRLVEEVCRHLRVESPSIRLAEVLDGFRTYCFIKDAGGRMAYITPELRQLHGSDHPDRGIPGDEPAVLELERRTDDLVLKDARTLSFVYQTTLTDGEARYFQTQKMPLVGPDRDVVGLFGVSREVSSAVLDRLDSVRGPLGAAPTVNVSELEQQLRLLDDRERELARLISRGAINKQVANHFDVSIRSVENWRRSLLAKLEIESVPELTRWVVRLEDYGLLAGD